MTVTISTPFPSDQVLVWIDFNKNGSFADAGEQVYVSAQGNGPHTGNITIPTATPLGSTRMRIRMHDAGAGPNATPCGNSTYGQVEDYTVNFLPCVPLSVTTQPVNTTVMCGNNTTFTINTTGSGATYQWEYRTTPTAPWSFVTNGGGGGVFSGATTNVLTLTGVPVSMNGYQFRAVYQGFCFATDFSSVATLTVTPLVANVTPNPATKCAGSPPVLLTITNIASPTTSTAT